MGRPSTDHSRERERARRKADEARRLASALAELDRLDVGQLVSSIRQAEQRARQQSAAAERAREAAREAQRQRADAIARLAAAVRSTGVPASLAAGLLDVPAGWLTTDGAASVEPQRDDHPPALPTLHPGAA